MKVVTARYFNQNVPTCGLAPVGITVGTPRWLKYKLSTIDRRFAPTGILFKVQEREEFKRLYVEKLDGWGGAREGIEELNEQFGDRGLVLMCYEDLRKPGEWCHRRVLAEYLQTRYGWEVPELDEPAVAKRTPVIQREAS